MIPLSVPCISGNEFKYVGECLTSGWVSSAGRFVEKFEQDICEHTGAKYAVACVNGTCALHVALREVGVIAGDEVIVPTLTFIAPVNTVKYVRAEPIFMDCDDFYNIDVEKVLEFIKNETVFKNGITVNKTTKKRIAAVMPVHVFGNAVDIERLVQICRERNIMVVEDAAESLGTYYRRSKYKNRYTGTVGEIGCYSFNGNKVITTGGGGVIVTNNEEYAAHSRYLTTQAKDDDIRYIHNDIGYNYRLTNLQAALGVAQLENLRHYIKVKQSNYQTYVEGIAEIAGLRLASVPEYASNNCWMYALQIDEGVYGKSRDETMKYLQERGIQTRPVWYLNHLQNPYKNCQSYKIDKAFKLWQQTLNIPCSVSLTIEQIEMIIGLLRSRH